MPYRPCVDKPPVRIGVLGDLIATGPHGPVDLGGRRQRAVLALLVIAHGDVVPAEALVESVWAQRQPADALGALQSFISHLRRRLEPGRTARSRGSVIASRGPGYAVSLSTEAVDAWRFEKLVRGASDDSAAAQSALAQALELWRGPAYAEYADEPWAMAEIARLRELRELARERLVAVRLARGESSALVGEIEALVNDAPLREERWRLLVLALYRAHRQGDALGALRRARQALADELGVDPGPALRALEADVLAQAPGLHLRAVTSSAPPVAHPTVLSGAPPKRAVADDLVDRSLEVAELEAAVAATLQRKARLVVVRGPAGIGKSRLLDEARLLAEEGGVRVCAARGSLLERDFGYGAVRQLFEPVLDLPGVLTGSAKAAGSVFDLATADPIGTSGQGSLAVMHGLYGLAANLAGTGPIMLSIDDLQWCDSSSLRFVAYLARRMDALPILIVATLRTGEPSADEAVLAELIHDPATLLIQPAPLSAEGVAILVRERFGPQVDDEFVAACQQTTSGNPLLLRQLLRALQSEGVRAGHTDAATVTAVGSRAISGLVLMRLSRMSAESTQVARAVAVLGSGAALPAVARLANLAEAQAAAVVDALARAEVLRGEQPLGFVHPLVADAVYRDIPPGERQLVHDRAAHLLDERGAVPEVVAAHLLHSPPRGDPWVVATLQAAATRARDRGAPDAAVTYLVRALHEPPPAAERIPVLLELGRVAQLANDPRKIEYLTDAYEALTDDPRQRAIVAQMLTRALIFGGERGEATRFARRAARELPADLVDEQQGLLAQQRVAGYMHDLPEGDWRSGAEPEITGDGIGARFLGATLAWEVACDGEDLNRAVRLARFAAADDQLLRVDVGHLWAVAGIVLETADEETGPYWQQGLAHSLRKGSAFGVLTTLLWLGYYQWQRGELRDALQSFRIVTELHQSADLSFGIGYSDSYAANVLIDQGDLAAAWSLVEGLDDYVVYGEGQRMRGEARARLLVAEGRPAEALDVLDSVAAVMAPARNPAWRPWRSMRAAVLLELGDHDSALSYVEEELVLARRWGAPRPIGRALCLRAQILAAAASGRPTTEALAAAREAVEVLRPTAARLAYARGLRVLASLVSGDESVALLSQAADLAWRCDAVPEYEGIVAALAALGAPPPTLPPGATRLTTWERDVMTRYLGGANERDIAEALFLTPATVRTMLDTARELLGGGSRADLRRALRAG